MTINDEDSGDHKISGVETLGNASSFASALWPVHPSLYINSDANFLPSQTLCSRSMVSWSNKLFALVSERHSDGDFVMDEIFCGWICMVWRFQRKGIWSLRIDEAQTTEERDNAALVKECRVDVPRYEPAANPSLNVVSLKWAVGRLSRPPMIICFIRWSTSSGCNSDSDGVKTESGAKSPI